MAKKKTVLAITLVTAHDRPPFRLNLNRWVLGLCLLVALVITGLAGVTVYNLLDGQTGHSRGDDLAMQNSSGTREAEQAKLIQIGQDRLAQLQKDNDARQKDVADLETQVKQLTGNIQSLQQLAQEIEQKLPAATTNTATPTPTANGQTGSLGGGNTQPRLDSAQARSYTNQYNKVLSQLQSINNRLNSNKLNLATQDIQVETFQQSYSQQKSNLDTQLGPNAGVPAVNPTPGQGQGQSDDNSGDGPPTGLPVNCPMTSKYGWRNNPFMPGTQQFHYGIDLGCYEGTPVLATKDGVVTHADYDSGYGNRVDISHAGGWLSIYGHNNRILVKVGQVVHKGDIIALSGNTGASTGPHVHYELHKDGTPIDPNTVLAVKLY
ncbi:MAG: peptidoglycan DD-metalloendopeptidase family protein [Chloroflexi bacterium]|nr:peptidoglycan DD-metalloendopeptidase family protein [Chloroflexota bacterium]OJV92347.1 MAG: hypothetical protein BGO39_30920 [Chloroflexi bacterium 54-19]